MKPRTWWPMVPVLLGLALLAAPAAALDQGDDPNVLLFDPAGTFLGSYHQGHWSREVAPAGSSQLQVTSEEYTNPPNPSDGTTSHVGLVSSGTAMAALVNDLAGAWPAPPAGAPAGSLYTFGAAIPLGTVTATHAPEGGSYPGTIGVTLTAYPATARVQYRTATVGPMITGGNTVRLFVYQDTTIQYRAVDNNTTSATTTVQYTIGQQPQVDTDRDGVPDAVEVALGLNPLTADRDRDSDGDGWSDLDEVLRQSDPSCNPDGPTPCQDPGRPLDSDNDGWSDVDEKWRHTDPADPADFPTARSLYEVERIIHGRAFATATDVLPDAVFQVRSLAAADLAAGVTAADGAFMGYRHGVLQPGVRVPVGSPAVLRVFGAPHLNFAAKRYVPSSPDVSPADVPAKGWETATAWLTAFREILAARLVEEVTDFDVRPASSFPLALMERQLEILAGLAPGSFLLLGTDSHPVSANQVHEMEEILALSGRSFNTLGGDTDAAGDLQEILDAAATCGATLLTDSAAVYAALTPPAPATPPTADANRAELGLAALYQGTPGRYLAGLTLFYPWQDIRAGVYGTPLCAILDPSADVDGDGLSNGAEVLAAMPAPTALGGRTPAAVLFLPPGTSNPFRADTDGDTVPDGVDNCRTVANPDQADLDGDHLGDQCDDDADNDGLDNGVEAALGTNPLAADTDGDGTGDGAEVAAHTDPGTIVTIDTLRTPTNQTAQTIKGTMEAGATVALTLPAGTSAQVDYPGATTWRAALADLPEGMQSVTVTATDASGNTAQAQATILVDLTPPVTTATPAGGTYFGQVEVHLTCDDEAGCREIRFCLVSQSGPACPPVFPYTGPITLTNDDTIRFQAWDHAGNVETVHEAAYAVRSEVRKGDINGNGTVDLEDAILAARITAALDTGAARIVPAADVDGDGKLGVPEWLYILQEMARP